MNRHTLDVLELPKIISLLTQNCLTTWVGPELENNLEEKNYGDAEKASRIMADALYLSGLLFHPEFPNLPMIEDFRDTLKRVRVMGTVLDGEGLGALMYPLRGASDLAPLESVEKLENDFSCSTQASASLGRLFSGLSPAKTLVNDLGRYLNDNGSLKEESIPELVRIQKQIQGINQEIMAVARSSIVEDGSLYTSDNPVFREGRVLLPLKSDFKGRLNGIIQGSSDSGTTLYLEPGELVTQNNNLFQARAEYTREIHRIFRILTERVRESLEFLHNLFRFWNEFDEVYIRARWILERRAKVPVFTQGDCQLPGARHPLLGNKVVPLELSIEPPCRILVISGPNTGGKTVALKTLGLFALLSQYGIPLPCEEGVRLPWYTDVYADIGDEQSIEENLSTFSAHLKNLSQILDSMEPGALVLLDELGTGTDPQEGGALALAILDALVDAEVYGMVTTHHGSLKAFAYSHILLENASMEFDIQTKSPSFRVRYGIPGESRALETARRVGFPLKTLSKAEQFLDSSSGSMDTLLNSLVAKERELAIELGNLTREKELLTNERQQLEKLSQDLEVQKVELLEKGLDEAEDYLATVRRTVEKTLQELKNHGDFAHFQSGSKEIRNQIFQVSHQVKERAMETRKRRTDLKKKNLPTLSSGMEVRVDGSAQTGVLIKQQKDGKWLLSAGVIKMTLEAERLLPVESNKGLKKPKIEYSYTPSEEFSHTGVTETPQFSLDLRGFRLEQALQSVQEQIDSAQVHGLGFFGIIHGKGTGVLQEGIHQYLRGCSSVKEFSFARPEEGGTGKTLVVLK
ncbi:MAG: hypothetical protein GW949_03215 [Spirochaetales bacterium]|nr:hypothetical protein [Spirochaetales bacterium]